jgi:crotonobetainyl-CoA:carnitine CoA-transferase CaiB-like acyl-CoA transferase
VTLDLAVPADRAAFEELVKKAHALITNLRPRAIRKLGLTYDALKETNPKLVSVALTGFGLDGPYSEYPAYDYIIQAMAGVMMLTGDPDGPPVRAGYSVVDNTGGMMAAIGLLAKLLEGSGGQIDVALYDTLLSQLNYLASSYLNAGQSPERHPNGAHAYFVPAQIFRTADGHIAIFITHDSFWQLFASEVGREDWRDDPRFATMAGRNANRAAVVADIQSELLKRTSAEWVERLRPIGLVVAAVGTLADALENDHTAAREMVVTIPTPVGPLRLIGNPIKIHGVVDSFAPPPLLNAQYGAHALTPAA